MDVDVEGDGRSVFLRYVLEVGAGPYPAWKVDGWLTQTTPARWTLRSGPAAQTRGIVLPRARSPMMAAGIFPTGATGTLPTGAAQLGLRGRPGEQRQDVAK